METEYIVLTHSMRELLPVQWLVEEVPAILNLEHTWAKIISINWEDNNGDVQAPLPSPPSPTY
eukprot:714039-Ditylum_brightwellii.AAC.1